MSMKHCAFCERHTQFKRKVGGGDALLILLTLGFYAFVILFYRKRCTQCGATAGQSRRHAAK